MGEVERVVELCGGNRDGEMGIAEGIAVGASAVEALAREAGGLAVGRIWIGFMIRHFVGRRRVSSAAAEEAAA